MKEGEDEGYLNSFISMLFVIKNLFHWHNYYYIIQKTITSFFSGWTLNSELMELWKFIGFIKYNIISNVCVRSIDDLVGHKMIVLHPPRTSPRDGETLEFVHLLFSHNSSKLNTH